MLIIPLLILLFASALCVALSRRVATRQLGLLAAGAGALAALVLVAVARRQPLPIEVVLSRWQVPDTLDLALVLRLDLPALALGLVVLVGGALALLLLALALAPSLRGYGVLFGYGLLVQASALLALWCATPLLLPFAWAGVALASFAAAWSSGALREGVDGSLSLLYALPASLLLLVGLLLGSGGSGPIAGAGAAFSVVLATALAAGLPPFRGTLDNLLAGPAALGGLLAGLGLPLVALATLWRLAEASPDLHTSLLWRSGLAAYGLLVLIASAASAVRERNLKRLLGDMLGAQGGVALVGLALSRLDDATSGPTLLLSNLALATLAGAAAVAGLEVRGRDDDYTRVEQGGLPLAAPPRLLALAWGLAAASALGVPPLWGFWGLRKLVENGLAVLPWAIPPLLFGLTLLAFALLLPLGGFLSTALAGRKEAEGPESGRATVWLFLPVGYLLLAGVLPVLAWPLAVEPPPLAQWVVWGALLLGVGGLLLVRRLRPAVPASDPELAPTILGADALGESVAPLAAVARPDTVAAGIWSALIWLADVAQFVMGLFERRYYLAGVLLALLSVLLIMAQ